MDQSQRIDEEPVALVGIYIVIMRDGREQMLDLTQLTEVELAAVAKDHPAQGWEYTTMLLKWIKENVEP